MGSPSPAQRTIRFGEFEADLASGELSRNGRKISLQDKPFRVLALLAQRPGELVTREELQRQLWPDDTFVDFEHGLNTAVKKLRQALDDSVESPRYVETLARRGYRLIAPAPSPAAPASPLLEPAAGARSMPSAGRESRYRRHQGFFLVASVLIAAGVGVAITRWRQAHPGLGQEAASIAVLPFDNLSRNAADDYMADGLTETLITDLARVKGLLVIARNSSFQYKGQSLDLRRVGSELGVRHLLEGSVQRDGDRLRVSAQLIDAETGYHVWADRYDRPATSAFAMQDEIARAVRRALQARVTTLEQPSERRYDTTPEAFDAYLRGMYRFEETFPPNDSTRGAERDSAIPLLEQAVALDPSFAAAQAMLGQAYANRVFYRDASPEWQQRAFVAIEKALALDPNLAEAYLGRADLTWTREKGFPHEAAMADLRRSIALNPNLVGARLSAARLYQHVGLFERALAELDAARRSDPINRAVFNRRGHVLVNQRLYQAALDAYAVSGVSGTSRVLALWGLGQEVEAERALRDWMARNASHPEGPSYLALTLAMRGDARGARAEIARAIALDHGESHIHHTHYAIGATYSVLGELDPAVEWLERSADEGFPCYPWFESDPNLAPLAESARFREFMARLKARFERHKSTL